MPVPRWKRPETWGIGIALVTLVFVILFTSRDWNTFQIARGQVNATSANLNLLSSLFSSAQDLETGQRGFLLVGAPAYLAPYEAAGARVRSQVAELERTTAGDAAEHARVQRIDRLLQRKMAELQSTVDLRQTKGFAAALAVVDSGLGKLLMDEIRVEVAAFQSEGQAKLAALEKQADFYRQRAAYIASGGSALLFVLLMMAAVLVRQRSDAREMALASVAASKREVEQVRDLLQTTMHSMGDAVITTDLEGRVTFLNPVSQELTGWIDNYMGRPLEEVFRIINEYTRETVESPVDKVRRTGRVAGLANHTILLARDGREIPIDDSGAPIRDGHGVTVGYVLLFRDITERRQAETALRENEDRFRTLANAAPVLLWVAKPDGDVTFVNRQWLEFTGRASEADLQSGWTQQVHPDDLDLVLQSRRRELSRTAPHSVECRLRRKDGAYRFMMCAEAPRFNKEGLPAGFVGAWFDITDLKEAQQSLELSERRFRTLVTGTTSMVWQTDSGGACVAPQPGWEDFTGQPFEEYRGFGGAAAMHPDDRAAVATQWKRAIESRGNFTMEYRLWHAPSKEHRYVVSRGTPLLDAQGEVREWVGTITDVTEHHRLEEKLQQAAKLESLGVLAGGIAHDFNNLLVGILGNAGLLEPRLADAEQREIVAQILNAGERAATLTRQMLAYSGRGRFVVEATDLSLEASQILPLLRSSISRHVELQLKLSQGLPAAEVDRAQFQQLVMNLVINAAEAIEGNSGTVTVSTFTHNVKQDEIADRFRGEPIEPGPYVVLEVRDTGQGMDAHTQSKIFDPFFTTKFAGRGLGLAAVIGIVRGHKGAIRVDSAPGAGSTFQIYLPVAARSLPAPSAVEQSSKPEERSATVLVVDDEEVVRRLAQNVLRRHGFQVLLASNGREAIDVLQANRDSVSVILLDLTMPVMSGEEALPQLRSISPAVRILASSGFNRTEAVQRFGNSIDGFIQKPYTIRNLLAALEAAREDGAGGEIQNQPATA